MRKHSTTHAPFDSGYPADVLGSSVPDIGGTSAALIEANACRVADRWIAFHGEHFWRWHSLLSHKHFTHQDGPGSGRFKRATCPWSELVAGAARDMVVASARTTAAEIAARSGAANQRKRTERSRGRGGRTARRCVQHGASNTVPVHRCTAQHGCFATPHGMEYTASRRLHAAAACASPISHRVVERYRFFF